MVQLPIYRVKQRHLEAFLAMVYRMDGFDFLLAAGTTPGMCPEYLVNPALPPALTAQQEADRIRQGRRTRNVGLILNVLCLDGFIPAGRYLIDTHPEPPPGQVYRALLMRSATPPIPDAWPSSGSTADDRAIYTTRGPDGQGGLGGDTRAEMSRPATAQRRRHGNGGLPVQSSPQPTFEQELLNLSRGLGGPQPASAPLSLRRRRNRCPPASRRPRAIRRAIRLVALPLLAPKWPRQIASIAVRRQPLRTPHRTANPCLAVGFQGREEFPQPRPAPLPGLPCSPRS